MKRILGALLFFLIISSACGSSTSIPTSTKVIITELPTVQPTASKTSAPKEPSPTYPPLGGTAIALATENALFSTQIAEFDVEALRCPTIRNLPWPVTISPDNQWMTGYCDHEGGNLSFINREGKIITINDREVFGDVFNTLYSPIRWSKDKESVYITTSPHFVRTPYIDTPSRAWCGEKHQTTTLIKFNYRTEKFNFILGNRDSYKIRPSATYTFALSQSEIYLAYSLEDRTFDNINILNLKNKSEIMVSYATLIKTDSVVSELLWSPDESKVLAILTMCESQRTKLLLIDTKNSNLKTIPIELPERYYVQEWIEPNLVVITNYSNGNLTYYYLDLSIDKIVGPIQ